MKIAHICLSIGKGGAEKLLVDNLPQYVAQGHNITIIQLSSVVEEPSYIDTLLHAGIKVISLSNGSFTNPLLFFKLLNVMRRNNYDIIHVHLFPCFYHISLASRLIRRHPILVFTEHCSTNRRIIKTYLRPLERFIYKKFDAIIAVSANVGMILKNWLPELAGRIKIINNGVRIEKFSSGKVYDSNYFFENFGLREADIKLFMASRFFAQKDQDTIVKSLLHLPVDFHILFAGDGERVNKVRELATNLGVNNRVHFLGFRTDMAELMRSADINILSTFFEGLSGVTLESLASGRPFLGSDVLGIKDIVPNENFIFEKENAKELSEKILVITSNETFRKKMMTQAREHVKQYDTEIMIRQHLELYEKLLNEKRNTHKF